MAKRTATRTLSDAYTKARSLGAKPARVSLIRNGIKYKSGQEPTRVCPSGSAVRQAIAIPLAQVVAEPLIPAAPAAPAAPVPSATDPYRAK
jgi:hypothetical protein